MRSRQFVGYIGLQLRSRQLAGEAHQEYSSTPLGVAQPGGQSVPLFPSGCLLLRMLEPIRNDAMRRSWLFRHASDELTDTTHHQSRNARNLGDPWD